jgi:hypothetical protein
MVREIIIGQIMRRDEKGICKGRGKEVKIKILI